MLKKYNEATQNVAEIVHISIFTKINLFGCVNLNAPPKIFLKNFVPKLDTLQTWHRGIECYVLQIS